MKRKIQKQRTQWQNQLVVTVRLNGGCADDEQFLSSLAMNVDARKLPADFPAAAGRLWRSHCCRVAGKRSAQKAPGTRT